MPSIHDLMKKANQEFFIPRNLHLDFLKNFPKVTPILAEWLYDEWHPYDQALTRQALLESFQKRMNTDCTPSTFVVLEVGVPIGVISIKHETSPEFADFPSNAAWMGSLYVARNARRRGVGEKLVRFTLDVAKALGYQEIFFYTSNPENTPWYISRGAQWIERRPFRGHKIDLFRLSY